MGPLSGVRVLELGSIGPGPFAAMVLSDLGAEVLRIERPGATGLVPGRREDPVARGRPGLPVDLTGAAGRDLVLALVERTEILIEGNRPGVLERLGLAPAVLHEHNPALVVGRITGYGQDGPLSGTAGHDINYIAISGALGAIARAGERPLAPLNLVGDYGGGGMLLVIGVLAALLEARASGCGQVVDAAMVDGSALLTTVIHGLRAGGMWSDEPGTNILDSGAHFYEVYETADGGHIAVGAIEPQFYAELLRLLELDPAQFPQWDRERWPELKQRLADVFRTKDRDAWSALLESAEACATPVLSLAEAPRHPHNAARGTFVERRGVVHPQPAPRFSRTPPDPGAPVVSAQELMERWGLETAAVGSVPR